MRHYISRQESVFNSSRNFEGLAVPVSDRKDMHDTVPDFSRTSRVQGSSACKPSGST